MNFAKTLFLFTKSDFKTILLPVTVFAISTAPLSDSATLPHLVFWIWLHILQCALANQIMGKDEDAINKPDRPIPSGRITIAQAWVLRWACVVPCLLLSAWYGREVLRASAALAFFLYIYNELGYNSHWLSRNVLNGAGLACFEVGATLIAGRDRTALAMTSKVAILISSSIFLTTIHTQDFKDIFGDERIGRRTLPMILPVGSRILTLVFLVAWSVGLMYIWNVGPAISAALLALSSIIGGRFIFFTSVVADQRSFYLYSVWLSLANALPVLT
ncbi:hypothetical protein K439DRAFT_1350349 [Ramaria rubella]|nr:hypothetical protein K439DRAFT_1350349 [Ramaria rubella]